MTNPTLQGLIEQFWGNNVAVYTWAALPENLAGPSVSGPGWTDRSIQFTGTFGAGGTVVLEGSNDGTNWFTLLDVFSNPLSFTSAGIREVNEVTLYMRPNVTAGDGTTSIIAVLCCANHSN